MLGLPRFKQIEGTTKILKKNFIMVKADKSFRNSLETAKVSVSLALDLESCRKNVPLKKKDCDSCTQMFSLVPVEHHHHWNVRGSSLDAQRCDLEIK